MFNSRSTENEWLKLLVRELCLEKPYFPAIFANLGSSTSLTSKSSYVEIYDARAKFRFQLEQQNLTTVQANLLCILCSILYEDAEDDMTATMKIAINTVVFLVDVISHSAQCAASLSGEACELPTGFPAIDALGYSLLLVRKLCAMESIRDNDKEVVREDLDPAGGFHEAGVLVSSDPFKQKCQMGSHLVTTNRSESRFEWKSSPSQVRYLLASHGLVPLMLKMLQALGPPATFEKVAGLSESVEQSQQQDHVGNSVSGNDNESSFGSLIHDAVNVCDGNNLSESDKLFPSKNLYRGFRRDLVSIIANISYRHFYVQEQIRENNGLLLLLQQCMVDKDNPFLREWGLWAIRNLLYDNEKNQQEVASLQLKGVANTSEILQTGLSVEIDPTTQRPKLVNVPVK
ncbi:hypothetical protein O6H91_07G079200 [Diphasiastrum complanatum]|nr:hypothetical protein O6H91_07G079200 [Diphasiastrum complanatum]